MCSVIVCNQSNCIHLLGQTINYKLATGEFDLLFPNLTAIGPGFFQKKLHRPWK